MANLQITRLHAINDGRVLLRLGEKLPRAKSFARSSVLNVGYILSNDLVIAQGQAGRGLPHLLQLLPIGGFLGFDNEVADAELLDEGHDFLLGARSDGEHSHNRGNAKDHTQHGQEGTQFVAGQIFEPEGEIRQPLLQRSWLGDGAGVHGHAPGFTWKPGPGWESGFHRSCCYQRTFSLDSQERRPFQAKCR